MPDEKTLEGTLWSGTVSFGLVAIPVNMVPATRDRRVAFHLLHDADNARLRRVMWCPAHQKPIHLEHMVRGFEIAPEKYVVVREAELEALEPKRSRTMEILEFVEPGDIDPIYYIRSYYLVPDGADKAYQLLVTALAEAQRVGIAKFVMHEREYVVAVRSLDGALCVSTLRFHHEIVPADDLKPKAAKVDEKNLQLVEKAIKEMTGKFHPGKYKDKYRERVLKLLSQKKLKTAAVPPGEEKEAEELPEPKDLIDALEASMAKARKKRK
jgi:DNA end-binding protein Ku